MAALKITGKIPENSLGSLVEALTDIIRPFSEARGLKADQIRIQREEVAIKIAKLARERASVDGRINSVPLKFMVPFLEKASLEDPENDDMIDLWANLLASASRGFDAPMYRFVNVLAELDSIHAKILKLVATNNCPVEKMLDFNAGFYCSPHLVIRFCMDSFDETNIDSFADAFFEEFSVFGSFFIDMSVYVGDDGYSFYTPFEAEFTLGDIEDGCGVLIGLGLLRQDIIPSIAVGNGNEIYISMLTLTEFGGQFYNACEGLGLIEAKKPKNPKASQRRSRK